MLFSHWLANQQHRTDEIGDLARWATQYGITGSYRDIKNRVKVRGSEVDSQISVLQRAHIEFTDCPVKKQPDWKED